MLDHSELLRSAPPPTGDGVRCPGCGSRAQPRGCPPTVHRCGLCGTLLLVSGSTVDVEGTVCHRLYGRRRGRR